jgi:hypothetical protein
MMRIVSQSKVCRRNALLLGVGLSFLMLMPGCNRGPRMYQVRGYVLYKNGTAPKGGVSVVYLQPKKDTTAEVRKGANSPIGPDGSFNFWTKKVGDGVYKGEYDVGFTVIKSPMDSKSLIEQKYTIPQTSGYSVTVDRDIDDLKFEIEPLPGVTGAAPTTGG